MERRGWWLSNGKINFFWIGNSYFILCFILRDESYHEWCSAKQANQANKDENEIDENNNEESNTEKSLSNELEKLNELRESGVLTQEEFEKAKNKLLNN